MPTVEAKKGSPASDFAEVETTLITLPRAGAGGKALSVVIRAVPVIELIAAMEGVPELNQGESTDAPKSFEQVRALILQQQKPQERIAAAGVVDPPLSFGDAVEADKAPWRNIHSENQAFIVKAIMDESGFGATPAKGAASQAATFREVAGA